MKIAVLGDTHFGMRGDHLAFHDLGKKFYEEVFFPYLETHNIKTVIQTGDLFDRRKFISFNTLYLCRKYFFDRCQNGNIELYTYLGNHDIYYKNTTEVNSISLLLRDYISGGSVKLFEGPATITFDGVPVDIIPWITDENRAAVETHIKSSVSSICFGHFELEGFEMDKNNVCHEGMKREYLQKYEMVISGHFHHKSTDGHIFYVGSPMEMTWADYDDARGFHIFDTETRRLEFIPNPFKMFHKVIYNDTVDNLETIAVKDFSHYQSTMLKVVVEKKENPVVFDAFMDKLYQVRPLEITVVEDFTDYGSISEEDIIDQADDTITIMDKAVESMNMGESGEKIKRLMRDIYVEAQQQDLIK
jgi:DNA repair exonuclease SbcCD nuclease subunit